ncbi:MAG: hypothetical protein JW913_11925, partial [Chitinispirillaceae bacterium]|nr:hypothetical protein [Chitinispirillaceae bacterium]
MIKKYPLFLQAATIVALYSTGAFAHEDGDALQLQTYIVESAADRPNVADGLLSTSGEEDDWKAAYARQITGRAVGGTTRDATIFFANEDDSLYLAVSIPSINTGNGQGFFMYFDLNNNGVLDGTAGTPGEYAISSLKDGAVSLFTEYGWNGSTWVANTIQTPGIKHGFGDGGAGGNHVFNFEIQLPILSTAPNAGQAFPDFSPGDEVGIMTVLTPAAGETTGNLFWDSAGTSVINPALWGELLINTALSSPRRFASLDAKTYVPTVTDGNITDDPNWKYAFDKTVTFSDFNGHKLSNCRIVIKESGAGTLYFGARITDNVFNDGDYFQIYFDQGDAGGAMNYTLNSGGSKNDDAMRVNGDGTTSDLYFNATGAGAWETDGGSNVTGGADSVSGAAWEFELAKPMASGDANDLGITSGQEVGILFRYYDADNTIDYWWSGSVNSDQMKLDLSNNNWNALGWAELVTGGPFVQPLYPEQNDIISGTYPFMLYAEDESSVAQIDSVDYRITDLNDNIVINYSSSTRMTKVDNASSGIWISTFNTNTGSTPDGDYNVVFRVKDNDGISVVAPVRIRIQNSGTVGGPTISNMSLNTGDVVAGTYRLTFDISPSGVYTLVADSIQISIDGGAWTVVDSTPAITGGTGRDSVNTAAMSDGVHTIRLRAKDSGNLAWGYSDLVIFNVNNSGSSSNVVIDSITGGSLKSGSVTVYFTATAGPNSVVDSCQISVDGLTWVRTTTGSSHTLNTVVLTEGTHLLQVRAFGSNNTTGYSRNASIETANGPTVTVTAPAADSAVSGTVVVTFTATPVAPATIDSTATAISVDGGA